jgi:hypothetical protein
MIRSILSGPASLVLLTGLALAGSPAPSLAQDAVPAKPKTGTNAVSSKTTPAKVIPAKTTLAKTTPATTATKPDPKKVGEKPGGDAIPGKPQLVATYGDWGAYAAKVGASKTCYALAQPKDRAPSNLKRDPAYIFIADRPAENVRNEVSIIMGFDVKGGDAPAGAGSAAAPSVEVGPTKFSLVAKGSNLWLANAAEEGPMIAAMRKSGKLVVRAASLKGNVTTDDYSLSGLAQALTRMQKECQ